MRGAGHREGLAREVSRRRDAEAARRRRGHDHPRRSPDLGSEDGKFATLDYSEDPPLVFLGEYVDFDSLKMTGLREFEGWLR